MNQTTTGIATAPLVGGAAIYSPLGFAVGAVGNAAGQAYQSYSTTGEVTIRPAQSVFSGVTGALALPLTAGLPAVDMSIKGAGALVGNAVAGGTTGAANTQFNNIYYDEATKIEAAAGLGAIFGASGSIVGPIANKSLSKTMQSTPSIPLQSPVAPLAAQGTLNPLPSQIGNSISNSIGAVPAFIPLDNGKSKPTNGTEEIKK